MQQTASHETLADYILYAHTALSGRRPSFILMSLTDNVAKQDSQIKYLLAFLILKH